MIIDYLCIQEKKMNLLYLWPLGSDGKNGWVTPTPPQRLSPSAPRRLVAPGHLQLEPAAIVGSEWQSRPSGWAGGNSLGGFFHSRPWTWIHASTGAVGTPRQASALGHPSGVWGAPQRTATWNLPLCTVSLHQILVLAFEALDLYFRA